MRSAALISSIWLVLAFCAPASAAEDAPVRQYPFETECRHKLPENAEFSAQEIWAWNEYLCLGYTADLSKFDGDKSCNADDPESGPATRRLSEMFLRTVLFYEPYKSAPPRRQVSIRCALFAEQIDLRNFDLESDLSITDSRFMGIVDLTNLRLRSNLTLDYSVFDDSVFLDRAQVGGQLRARRCTFTYQLHADGLEAKGITFLKDTTFKGGVDLKSANLGDELAANGSTFEGTFDAVGLKVHGNLYFDNSSFKDVDLLDAEIGGLLSARNATFDGLFDIERSEVRRTVFLDGGSNFKQGVNLRGASIGSQLIASGSTFEGLFNADGLEVKGITFLDGGATFKGDVNFGGADLGDELNTSGSTFEGRLDGYSSNIVGGAFLDRGAEFTGPIDFTGAKFGSSVALYGSTFHAPVDFTAATVAGDLILTSPSAPVEPPKWAEGAKLILRDSRVRVLRDSPLAWCADGKQESCERNDSEGIVPVDLTGFAYQQLGSLDSKEAAKSLSDRKTKWLLAWMAAGPNHSAVYGPQPYTQLAKVLREAGDPAAADDILYHMRDHERTAANTPAWRKASLTLQWLLIGYGYYNWWALAPFTALILVGVWACGKANETMCLRPGHKIWYSVSCAIPVVKLGATEGIGPPSNWVRSYFYVHQIIGFVLVSFLVAGLSGLTK